MSLDNQLDLYFLFCDENGSFNLVAKGHQFFIGTTKHEPQASNPRNRQFNSSLCTDDNNPLLNRMTLDGKVINQAADTLHRIIFRERKTPRNTVKYGRTNESKQKYLDKTTGRTSSDADRLNCQTYQEDLQTVGTIHPVDALWSLLKNDRQGTIHINDNSLCVAP